MHVDTLNEYYACERNVSICVGLVSPQGEAQLYTKCGDNSNLAQLSANIAVEVILRKRLGEALKRFVILDRDDTCYMRSEGNPQKSVG